MKTDTFKFHLVESFKSLRRNGWMSIAAVSAVTVTLLLVGIFLSAVFNVNKISNDIESDVRVRVSIENGTTQKQKDQLKAEIEDINGVTDIKFSSKETELNNIVKVYGKAYQMVGGDSNPLMDIFIVKTKSVKDTKSIATKIAKMNHVSSADYGGKQAKKLFGLMNTVRQIALIFSLILVAIAIFLISNTIRITILSRRNEIEIMQLVGATNSFIRTPFVMEGAWTGILGAIIPIILVDVLYSMTYRSLSLGLANSGYHLIAPGSILFWLDLLIFMIGMGIGALGSVFSIRRFLKLV